MKKLSLLFSLLLLAVTTFASDHSFYKQQLSQGEPGSIRSASKSIINNGIRDEDVIDVVMEVILQNASKGDKNSIDALAWASKAVAASGNARYSTALTTVSKNKSSHKKLRKYAKNAAKSVGKPGDTKQYTKGTVDLAKIKAEAQAERAKLAKTLKGKDGFKSIAAAREGMSASELAATCGPPTSTTSHITGKQFRPFNFKGGDTVRTIYLYKGQGRITVSNNSHYSTNATVIEIVIDPTEPGFR